jgi:hypothetical protein
MSEKKFELDLNESYFLVIARKMDVAAIKRFRSMTEDERQQDKDMRLKAIMDTLK